MNETIFPSVTVGAVHVKVICLFAATASAEHAVVHLVGPDECFTVYCFHNDPGEDDAIDLSWGVPLSELGHLLTKVILAVQA